MDMKLLHERFDQHRKELEQCFFVRSDHLEITGVEETGDRHLHGEAVLRVDTTLGEFYYKPRDCSGTELLGELNHLLFGESLVPGQITGEGYAFQKSVAREVPAAGVERADFYEWLGKLTAVFYALGSTDMHRFNVVPAGGRPCVIDTETLLCARAEGIGGAGDFSVDYGSVFPEFQTSVGECMVLPRFYARLQKSSLLPGNDCTPAGYEYQFLDGFRYGYQAIRDKKEEVFSLLERYKHFAVRYLLRSTGFYNTMIAEYTAAASNKERECILGRLEKGLDDAQKQYWRPIIDWEAACVSEGDVPYFWFYANERTLRGDRNGVRLIDGFLIESPIDYAKYRILRMDQYDLAVQCSYIQASMKHIDGWTDPAARFFRSAERIPDRLTPPLAAELAVREAVEVLHAIWDERIPLSGGRCLWHVPMIDGKTSSLYGLSEGFAGISIFCRAMTDSRLLTGMDAVMAEELAEACLQDMLAFGGYLLNEYPDPPSERIIMRRFDGGFGFENGLAGFLWALEHIRDTQNREIERMLEAFSEWHIRTYCEGALEKLCMTEAPSWADTDILAGGVAGYAVSMMSAFTRGDTTALGRAGCMLAWMVEQKKITGCYKLFRAGRKQYFLPAFLRGNAGIAYVMLHYAKLSDVNKQYTQKGNEKL